MEVVHARCAGLDVHPASVVACVRVADGRRVERPLKSFGTTTQELLRLVAWLESHGCTHVAMESSGGYWKPVFRVAHCSDERYRRGLGLPIHEPRRKDVR